MQHFQPQIVVFRKNALNYPLGEKLYQTFSQSQKNNQTPEIKIAPPRGKLPLNYDLPFSKKFHRAKRIILVSVRTVNKFQTCKPSANYQLPLVSGCPGHCHYCYLSTNLGKNPYIKVYVNLKEILNKAREYIKKRKPELTTFEGAATSDPLPVEKWTGSLKKAITCFAQNKYARFRFVSKFSAVEPLLNIEHNDHTEIRFSLNTDRIIKKYEPKTPHIEERIRAGKKVFQASYPTGFLIAPVFIYANWQTEYQKVIEKIQEQFPEGKNITLEIITHRYTKRAKEIINKAYPENKLPMDDQQRKFKYGQFGYGKYIYPQEKWNKIETFFEKTVAQLLPRAEIKYVV